MCRQTDEWRQGLHRSRGLSRPPASASDPLGAIGPGRGDAMQEIAVEPGLLGT
jgi:hypothetical protein